MISDTWIRQWVKKKIEFYETYLKKNQKSPIKSEVEENIRILKELI